MSTFVPKYRFPTNARRVTRATMELDYSSDHSWYRPDPDAVEPIDWRALDVVLGAALVFAIVILGIILAVVHYIAPAQ